MQGKNVVIMPSIRFAAVAAICLGLVSFAGAAGADDAKLKALDAAYQAGVLSEDEYKQKKAELSAAGQSKLEALEAAQAAGLLTQEEYARKKAEITGTTAAPATPPPAAPAATPAKKAGKTYRHVSGSNFWYPDGWKVQELEGFLQLIPPDFKQDEGPFIVVGSEGVTGYGIEQANHPMVLEYVDGQMQMLGSETGLQYQRAGSVTPVNTSIGAGKGIRVDYEAQGQTGPRLAETYAVVIRDQCLLLLITGLKNKLPKFEPDVQRIFASFGCGEGKKDGQLVGRWQYISDYAIVNDSVWETDYSRARMASETTSVLTFLADGSWTRWNKSEMIVGGAGIWLESNDETESKGRWNADGGELYMVWEDQSWEDYNYKCTGNQLRLQSDTTGQVWERVE